MVCDIKWCVVIFFPQSYSESQTEFIDDASPFQQGTMPFFYHTELHIILPFSLAFVCIMISFLMLQVHNAVSCIQLSKRWKPRTVNKSGSTCVNFNHCVSVYDKYRFKYILESFKWYTCSEKSSVYTEFRM